MRFEQAKTLTAGEFHRLAASLKPETRMVIDGELVEARSGGTFETVNPADGVVLAVVPSAGREDVDRAVASARRAFKSGDWSRLEPRTRMEVLYRFADLINENALELALLDALDVGKPVMDTLGGDVPAAALTFQYFAETIDKIEGVVTNTGQEAFHYILRQPLGVVGCITPWNYPLLMAAWKVAPALAAGNSVVLKPANDSIYGLAASIWTSDITTAHKVARDIDAGVIWINCYDLGDMTQPWGGFKQSGAGRDKCLETLLTVTQTKSVWVHLG